MGAGGGQDPAVPLRYVRGVLAEHMGTHGIPGGIAVVAVEGRVAGTVCLGTTDRRSARPVASDQVVALGPASKTLAVIGVLRLVAEGVLGLDDFVADHLSGGVVALGGNPMTVGQLLSQRGSNSVAQVRRNRPWSAARSALVPSHAPGWSLDVARIADLVSSVSGEPFEVYMAKNVFAPMEMWSGSFSRLHLVSTDVGPGRRARPGTGTSRPMVAGAHCTPVEFGRFLGTLAGNGSGPAGTLLAQPLLARMTTPSAPLPASGLGVWLERGRAGTVALVGGNSGEVAGAYAPGTGVAVVLALRGHHGPAHAFPGPSRLAGELLEGIVHGPSPLVPEGGPAPTFPRAS